MGYNTYNNVGGDGLWSTDANWSDGTKPDATDTAYPDGTTDANLTVDENAVALGIEATAAYDGNIDFGDSKSHAWGSDGMVFDHTGDVDLGTGTTHTITGGDYDVNSIGGLITVSDSAIVMNGAGELRGKNVPSVHDLKINSGATISQLNSIVANGIFEIAGSLSQGSVTASVASDGEFVFRSTANISGSGTLQVNTNTLNAGGVTTFESGATVAPVSFWVFKPRDGCPIAAGNYQCQFKIQAGSNGGTRNTIIGAGAFTCESLELEATGITTLGFDLATNNPTVTIIGDLTIDIDSTGGVTLDASSNALTLQGDLIDEITGAGTFTADSQDLTLSGTNNQDIDGCGGTWGDIIVNKTAGTVTLSGTLTCNSFAGTDGDLDLNGQTLTVTRAFLLASGFTIADPAGSTVNCQAIIADGIDLIGSATWYANCDETSTLHNLTIANCDASGGEKIDATDNCVDGGGNSNLKFLTVFTMPAVELTIPAHRMHFQQTGRFHFEVPGGKAEFTVEEDD